MEAKGKQREWKEKAGDKRGQRDCMHFCSNLFTPPSSSSLTSLEEMLPLTVRMWDPWVAQQFSA